MSEILEFSDGKDSWACLYLLRNRWSQLTVLFMNTGAAFPETLEQIERVRALKLHVEQAESDVLKNIGVHGWPTDVLPVRNGFMGKLSTGESGIRMQSWWNCCHENFWAPMDAKARELGATVIYRGQRNSEDYKSPARDRAIYEGVTYRFPLQDWTEEDVERYLRANDVMIPAHYEHTSKSLDCWCCTAYLDAKLDQLRYLRAEHPGRYATVREKLAEIRVAVHKAALPLDLACELEI